jgi:hypothetical protein
MSETPEIRQAATAFRRPAPGIVVHLEYRIRCDADRRRRGRRSASPWTFHERRTADRRRCRERRHGTDARLEQLALEVLRRHAVHDADARRLVRRLERRAAATCPAPAGPLRGGARRR